MRLSLLVLLIPALAFAQEFQFHQELDSIPVWDGEYQMPAPWTGGYWRSSPTLADFNGDGLLDIVTGGAGTKLQSFTNIGTNNYPLFILDSPQFGDINCASLLGDLNPVFCNIDADGDQDLLIGTAGGIIQFYENIGSSTQPSFILAADTLRDENGVLVWCQHPACIDIDNDGDLDLLCGRYTGTIGYYLNVGNAQQYSFHLVTDQFEGINFGYQNDADPTFCDIDSDGDYDLFIGNKYGKIYFYRNDGTPQQYDFTLVSNNWFGIDVGDYASPEFCDIDGDGDYDLFIGKDNDLTYDIPGAMQYWENTGTPQVCNFVLRNQNYLTFDAGCSCEPDLCDIDLDGDLDLFFLTNSQLGWMENTGTNQNPEFTIRTFDLLELPPGSCDLGDLNGDQYPDLVTVNGWGGAITLWVNRVTPQNPTFVEFSSIDTDWILYEVSLGDLDADGDLDMIVGGEHSGGFGLLYYQNQGTPSSPNFVQVAQSLPGVTYNNTLNSSLVDFNLDGRIDLLIENNWEGAVYYYENIGSPQSMNFNLVTTNLLDTSLTLFLVDAADIDSDGKVDIFTGHYEGGMRFFRNVTGDSTAVLQPTKMRPRPSRATLSIGPNPSNPVTAISYQLSAVSLVNLSVYDISGRRVAQLVNGRQNPGEYNVSWNSSGKASGVYLIRLDAGQQRITQKVVVVK
ncbi:MAG: T9SS type A sorting domain-containing protein [bacterium]|nr:T9SS type A sorting domain-containing protein [bacterium]